MATSIQTIGDRAEVMHDLDLLALLVLLNDTATQAPDRYPSLHPFFQSWEENCIGYGPGMLDLRLEDIVAHRVAKSQLEQLLIDAEHKLSGFGEMIPASLLAACKAPGVTLNAYSSSNLKSTIERIRSLMQ